MMKIVLYTFLFLLLSIHSEGQSLKPKDFQDRNIVSFVTKKGFVLVKDSLSKSRRFYSYTNTKCNEYIKIELGDPNDEAILTTCHYYFKSKKSYDSFILDINKKKYMYNKKDNSYKFQDGSYSYYKFVAKNLQPLNLSLYYKIEFTFFRGKELSDIKP